MQVYDFPENYKIKLENDLQYKITNEKRRCQDVVNRIRNERVPAPQEGSVGKRRLIGGIVGLVGYATFFSIIKTTLEYSGVAVKIPEVALNATWAVIVIGVILGGYIGKVTDKRKRELWKIRMLNIDNRIKQEETNSGKCIQNYFIERDRKYQEYYDAFESESQRLSAQFAESELAKGIISWMTEGFCRTIDATDRRVHIENIEVPFRFDVFNDSIKCNLGNYDFEINRCDKLKSPIEQVALARAIATAIQLNIVMKYNEDVSGTPVFTDIEYEYTDKFSKATIFYRAKNGNYKLTRSWK